MRDGRTVSMVQDVKLVTKISNLSDDNGFQSTEFGSCGITILSKRLVMMSMKDSANLALI